MSGSTKPREMKKKKNNNNNSSSRNEAKQGPVVLMFSSSSSDSEDPNGVDEEAKSSNNSNQHINDETLLDDGKGKNLSTGTGTGCCFPTNRIKRIIRSEGADFRTTQEAIFLINKATEQFLELFCEDAYAFTRHDRQKAVGYKHLSSVVCKGRRCDFLLDFVPEKVRAEDALSERLAET